MNPTEQQMFDIERTMEVYRHDPIIAADPSLAVRILEQHSDRSLPIRRWTTELRFSEAAVALSVLINLAAMVYVLAMNVRHDAPHDALSQLRAEYDVEAVNSN